MRRGSDAHAWASGRVARLASAGGRGIAGEARTQRVGGSGGAGGSAARANRARSRLRIRKAFRGELSVAGTFRRITGVGISAAGGHFPKIFYWTNAGWRREGRSPEGPALWNACNPDGLDSQRRAHFADSRCEGGGGSGTGSGRDSAGTVRQ